MRRVKPFPGESLLVSDPLNKEPQVYPFLKRWAESAQGTMRQKGEATSKRRGFIAAVENIGIELKFLYRNAIPMGHNRPELQVLWLEADVKFGDDVLRDIRLASIRPKNF